MKNRKPAKCPISSREVELRYVQSKNIQLLKKNEENLHVLIGKIFLKK